MQEDTERGDRLGLRAEIEERAMVDSHASIAPRGLTTPRAAAIAGVVFAVIFGTSLLLLRAAMPTDAFAGTDWVTAGRSEITVALTLMPFAGIAFLWFMGVLRDRIGDLEDRFFSTVFYGSGLLFLALIFVGMSVVGGIVASAAPEAGHVYDADVVHFGQTVVVQVANVYGVKMAAVFMISVATIWRRTGTMPRWMVGSTYLLALAMLLVFSVGPWLTMIFPAWVLVVSAFMLATGSSTSDKHTAGAAGSPS